METGLKYPVTIKERMDLGPELLHFSGDWKEFWALMEVAQYNVEFQNNEIIAMSYESDLHSRIASMVLTILANLFNEDDHLVVHDMNRPVYIEETGAVYNPDASVVSDPGEKLEYKPGMNAEKTPIIIVEVLSKTTRDHDFENKLPAYKSIPGIRYILYIETGFPYVTVFSKNNQTGQWTNRVYDEIGGSFQVDGHEIALQTIYKKVKFL